MSLIESVLAVLCGGVVGYSLGLIGGGGSILSVPMILYVVGVKDAHVAIGTSVAAVSLNAFIGFADHWRNGHVNWPCATVFAGAGVIGAAFGSSLGNILDGESLIVLFAAVMIAAGIAMLIPRKEGGSVPARLGKAMAIRLASAGFATGFLSGFFGIGGGFLIVPGIILASGMPILNAVGSSLFAVGAFGLTTAINYAISGFIDWGIAAAFGLAGAAGSHFGLMTATVLAQRKQLLNRIFAALIFAVAAYMIWRSSGAIPLSSA